MIAYFGDMEFEVNGWKVMTFTEFSRKSSARWAEHEVIGEKPMSQFLGPELDVVTFTVPLNASYGLSPRHIMEMWLGYNREGLAFPLIIGDKPLGVDKWVVIDINQEWGTVLNDGKLYSGSIDVTLKEYISYYD